MRSLSQTQIKDYCAKISAGYVKDGWLNIAEGTMLNHLFATLLERKLGEFRVHIGEYHDIPEELIPVLTAFTRTIAVFVNDQSNTYRAKDGRLNFRCISRDGVWQRFSKFTGEESHELTVFLDGKAPEGYKHHKDDHLVGARDARSGPVSADEAWDNLARVCEESLARKFERQEEYPWHLFAIDANWQKSHRETQQYIREKRIFTREVEQEKAARNAVSYQYWRYQNRDKLKRFGL